MTEADVRIYSPRTFWQFSKGYCQKLVINSEQRTKGAGRVFGFGYPSEAKPSEGWR